jgi:hypothetical protein
MYWGTVVWMVMPVGVKNGPLNFQSVVNRAFIKCLDQFMKIFLNDFMVYSDMESHLMKLRLGFQNCKKYKINFNLDICAFMVFSRLNLRFIVSKEGTKPQVCT